MKKQTKKQQKNNKKANKKPSKRKQLKKIYKDIKQIKIQGATNIAKAAIRAYMISPKKSTIRKLKSLRPTEPMLQNVLDKLEKADNKKTKQKKADNKQQILQHFNQAQEKINKHTLKLINPNNIIFTHCHSTNVVKALIYAKKQKKNFEVYNTETRPLYQGRKTAKQLTKAKIKTTTFTDSALGVALSKEQGTKKADKVFLGADAILKNGDIINKIGSETIAIVAKQNKIPVYIIADSWKFTNSNIKLEQRKPGEVWDDAPKNIQLKNPAFEKVSKKFVKAIVSELGVLSPREFVRKARKQV